MKRILSRLYVLVVASLLGGCLEFEEQTMSYRYAKATDELRIFQDYHGICGGDAEGIEGKPLSSQEQGQLKSVLEGQRTFFFENWIFEYNREDVEQHRARLKDPEKRAESGIAEGDVAKIEELLDLLINNIRVDNGPFYLDAGGKLCAVQSVTAGKWSEIVAEVNACAPILLKSMAGDESTTPHDRQAAAKFAKGGNTKLLQFDGNSMILRWPMSRASYDETFGAKSDDPARAEEIRAAGIGVDWTEDVTTFTMGKKDDEITRVTLSSGDETEYTPNAIASVRKQHTVRENLDATAAARTFLLGKEVRK